MADGTSSPQHPLRLTGGLRPPDPLLVGASHPKPPRGLQGGGAYIKQQKMIERVIIRAKLRKWTSQYEMELLHEIIPLTENTKTKYKLE